MTSHHVACEPIAKAIDATRNRSLPETLRILAAKERDEEKLVK
tara:strand:+ start:980 stop:1108 length:129 start_codon:yes stop_codon:yes gene_type:complete